MVCDSTQHCSDVHVVGIFTGPALHLAPASCYDYGLVQTQMSNVLRHWIK